MSVEREVAVTVRLKVTFQPEDCEGASDEDLIEMAVRETRLLYEAGRDTDGYWNHLPAEEIDIEGELVTR